MKCSLQNALVFSTSPSHELSRSLKASFFQREKEGDSSPQPWA